MAFLGNLNFNKNNIMQEITFRNDLNPSHCGYIWMKVTVVSNCTIVKYLHLYTVLQKISSHPLKVTGFGISILVGCPKRAVQKLFFRKFYDTYYRLRICLHMSVWEEPNYSVINMCCMHHFPNFFLN